jgi:hypothetical protein
MALFWTGEGSAIPESKQAGSNVIAPRPPVIAGFQLGKRPVLGLASPKSQMADVGAEVLESSRLRCHVLILWVVHIKKSISSIARQK